MDVVAQAALSNAVIVSVLAPIVLAADRLCRRPALAHGLWLLLLIKLITPPLLPIAVPWPIDSPPARPAAPTAPPADPAGSRAGSIGDGAAAATGDRAPPADLDPEASGPRSRVTSLAEAVAWHATLRWRVSLASIWLAVSGCWLVRTLVQLVGVGRRLGAVPLAPPEIQDMAREIARKLDLNDAPRVWFVPGIMSPALWAPGRRPRILVPEGLWDRLDEDQRAALLAHELAHLRRRDHWIRPLELFVIGLYWWFPVAWWMRKSLRDAEEQCCDAWVVWLMPESKAAYARTLLETIDFLAEAPSALPMAASGFGTVATLKTRLGRIMRGSRHRSLSRTGSAWVTGLALVVSPLAWRQGPDPGVPRGYRIIDLGPFDPIAINNVGQIIGNPTGRKPRAHRWERGGWTDLAGRDDVFITATDINDRGQVTGWYEVLLEPARRVQTKTPNVVEVYDAIYSPRHAFRTAPNRPINLPGDDIGTLGGQESRGLAINDAGQVAGVSGIASMHPPPSQPERAFRTRPDRPIDPSTDQVDRFDAQRADHSVLEVAMNNLGDVVISTDFSDRRPAFHAAPGRTIETISPGLGPDDCPGTEVRVKGINDHRQVVARAEKWGGRMDVSVSFRLDPGRRIDPETDGLPRSFVPQAINVNGLVLGTMREPWTYPYYSRGTICDGGRVLRLSDLLPPGSGWLIWRAADINDRNQVIGMAIGPDTSAHGVLLDPAPDPTPCFWILAGTVLTGLGHGAGRVPPGGAIGKMSRLLGPIEGGEDQTS